MKFTISCGDLLAPLSTVVGVVERRQTLAILANALISVENEYLALTGTDLEVELIGRHTLSHAGESGKITVPARKFYDICRSFPPETLMQCTLESTRFNVKAGRSRFVLQTLPAADFPMVEESQSEHQFHISQKELRYLLEQTHFAIAQQDVRYYLNGLLLELRNKEIRTVATDGHRMAICTLAVQETLNFYQVIVPRKGVGELLRLLQNTDETVEVTLSPHHIRVVAKDFTLTSKLIDGKYPDYNKVLPKPTDRKINLNRDEFKQALSRVIILSNEKFRGVTLLWQEDSLQLQSHNADHEEAEERLDIQFSHPEVQLGFNASYLMDVINCIASTEIELCIAQNDSGLLLKGTDHERASTLFVVMPVFL